MSVELYFLGAGKPSSGRKPAALKNIVVDTKAMDWQLHSFEDFIDKKNIYYLGGYHVEEVAQLYPELNFSIISDWQTSTALDTLLQAPFSGDAVVISYTDTLFRKKIVRDLVLENSQVSIVIDSHWLDRYSSRSSDDILKAEKLIVDGREVEFTGLIYLGREAVLKIRNALERNRINEIGVNLVDIIDYLEAAGLTITYKDVCGDWSELNSPSDVANFIFGTKADTLARLKPVVTKSHIGTQQTFTAEQWSNGEAEIISKIQNQFGDSKLVVRSSSKLEDNWHSSNAGGFTSILDVACMNKLELAKAIQAVVDSYGHSAVQGDQVLIQKFLQNVAMAGVVFTCTLESGAPYYRFNYDDSTKSTESVTAGIHADLRTVLVSKLQPNAVSKVAPELSNVLLAVQELESLLNFDKLDIEFAVDESGQVHIFQVRPVVVNHDNYELETEKIADSINSDVIRFSELQKSFPFVVGEKTIFANMPDWNPAEIISTRPKPLAFSLYQELITNEVWATQRAEFGYRDVRHCPLIVSFSGQPYVDVRISLNSFIPESVSDEAAERIVNAYLSLLSDNPHYHDKLEFDVAFTIWTPSFLEASRARLMPYGVTDSDIVELEMGLKQITKNALTRLDSDIASVKVLANRFDQICEADISIADKIYALLFDCKRFGTKAFSHAARAGFVATTLLKDFVDRGVMSDVRRMDFLNSFDTVAGEFEKDKFRYHSGMLTEDELLKKYGHLRPGTYEVSAVAYWEDKYRYILTEDAKKTEPEKKSFEFSKAELSVIRDLIAEFEISISEKDLIEYLIKATKERERVKFEFTRNLSRALDLFVKVGEKFGLSRDEVSFLSYRDLESLKLNTICENTLRSMIEARKEEYQLTKLIELPELIDNETQFYSFERHGSQPNFVGVDSVEGDICSINEAALEELAGKIIMIPQADPGYDWLFGHGIAGLVTQYGGANSHMAIRSAEIGLPAVIGIGEKFYESLLKAKRVELDCVGCVLRVIQ